MDVITTTPFGRRPLTAALMKNAERARAEAAISHINKWDLFRELCTARAAFGVSDRDLTVLNALLSFHRGATLEDAGSLIVFPSNATLSDRAHGMAESTLRRHLAALVEAGLIQRHDSPNGKRYAARDRSGDVVRAFGFDLRPLLVRAAEIVRNAAETRAATDRFKHLREETSLLRRDVYKLIDFARAEDLVGKWDEVETRLAEFSKALRRKLSMDQLREVHLKLTDLRQIVTQRLSDFQSADTEEMGGNDRENERHYQNTNTETYESEDAVEKVEPTTVATQAQATNHVEKKTHDKRDTRLPLAVILKACPDILPYHQDAIRHWHQLVGVAGFLCGMMGIKPDLWARAQAAMGAENASITLACILQKVSEIRSPGGYFRTLIEQAEAGRFTPGPMVMALLNTSEQQAA
ncbi:plasmid replication protein RepC [Actibacterium sp. D379-3]